MSDWQGGPLVCQRLLAPLPMSKRENRPLLCRAAEASHSRVEWVDVTVEGRGHELLHPQI